MDKNNKEETTMVYNQNSTGSREIKLARGRTLKASPVFDSYWKFACKRQDMFMRRIGGAPPPWTDNRVLASGRFTNVYRASDRVSQYLIKNVIYEGRQTAQEIFFRTLLFKIFNKIETWETLKSELGEISWKWFEFDEYAPVLDTMKANGQAIYNTPAYRHGRLNYFNETKHHRIHLRSLEWMMEQRIPAQIERAKSLRQVYEILHGLPLLGGDGFLAFQYTIDLNYSEMINFAEMDFVKAGPGAVSGIYKCFAGLSESEIIRIGSEIIRAVADIADDEFDRRGLKFQTLWGRPLQLIDIQSLFCEVNKYARSVHPDIQGTDGSTQIRKFKSPNPKPLPQWYPPKWKLQLPAVCGGGGN